MVRQKIGEIMHVIKRQYTVRIDIIHSDVETIHSQYTVSKDKK